VIWKTRPVKGGILPRVITLAFALVPTGCGREPDGTIACLSTLGRFEASCRSSSSSSEAITCAPDGATSTAISGAVTTSAFVAPPVTSGAIHGRFVSLAVTGSGSGFNVEVTIGCDTFRMTGVIPSAVSMLQLPQTGGGSKVLLISYTAGAPGILTDVPAFANRLSEYLAPIVFTAQ
jgi:hypothetical protein